MPASTDATETKLKELEIRPLLTQHFVYPLTNYVEPTLVVKILAQNIIMLLDTGAHVSVLPKKLITDTISIPDAAHAQRHVKVFGGEEVVLNGPILLDIVICGVHIVHPFFSWTLKFQRSVGMICFVQHISSSTPSQPRSGLSTQM